MSSASNDRDLLAAEFALGTLERHEARAIEAMAEGDRLLSAAIERWQSRLAPLARLVPPLAAPPEIWDRLELATAPALPEITVLAPRPPARAWGRVGFWRGTTAGALALAAAIAGIAIVHTPAASPMYIAGIAPIGSAASAGPAERLQRAAAPDALPAPAVSTPGFMCASLRDGSIMVKPIAPVQVPAGKELQLWARPPGAQYPVSLGVLPAGGTKLPASDMVQPDTKLMVSLEPEGGSPTGQPTGPVLYAGTLARIE